MEIQTDPYLEEFVDTLPEAYASTQTDAFLDRAPSPLYIPMKSGVDIGTQILDGDLFDFDMEVEPILEVLVGKTLDQAVLEVSEEQELAVLRKRQRDFEVKKLLSLMEVQRLEQAEKRHLEEKERRKKEAERILKEKEVAVTKVTAASFAAAYLSKLVPSALDSLEEDGFFYNVREREIQQLYLPSLTEHVQTRIAHALLSRQILDGMLILH
ncbi:Radial spoke head protein 3 [Coelomomyces lativittatus]|nr:Radial spoke head protein 3 [Coelomomyces lativittatus]